MLEGLKYAALFVVFVAVMTFGLTAAKVINLGTWGPIQEEIRYDIHKESQAHRDGLQRNLAAMINQYNAASGNARAGVKAAIQQQYSQADTSEFPQYMKDFLINEIGIY